MFGDYFQLWINAQYKEVTVSGFGYTWFHLLVGLDHCYFRLEKGFVHVRKVQNLIVTLIWYFLMIFDYMNLILAKSKVLLMTYQRLNDADFFFCLEVFFHSMLNHQTNFKASWPRLQQPRRLPQLFESNFSPHLADELPPLVHADVEARLGSFDAHSAPERVRFHNEFS